MRLRIFSLLGLLGAAIFAGQAYSQSEAIIGDEERQQLLERARALRGQASAKRQDADQRYAAENDACWKKFLVTSCMDDAKMRRVERVKEARLIEREARDIEHDVREREVATREMRWGIDNPRREAEAAARAERNRLAQQQAMERVERKLGQSPSATVPQ